MNVLLIGSGGREHALAWKLAQSPLLRTLYAAPGNPGIAAHAKCVALDPSDAAAVAHFCVSHGVTLAVIGPEAPLVAGLADALRGAGIDTFGPSAAAAQLEGSKGFTKDLCSAANIPTAAYERFRDAPAALAGLADFAWPVVLKADGLAAGKGVTIAHNQAEAAEALAALFSEPGVAVVIEEFLEGEEVSLFVLTDGRAIMPFGTAQDHKRVGDGDTGPNTGGMGAYSPARVLTPALEAQAMREIIEPTVAAMLAAGMPFSGVLYAGLMLTSTGPQLIEYNARLGDPECQALMLRLKSDLLPILLACARGTLGTCAPPVFSTDPALTVVVAANGYPGAPASGGAITGLDQAQAMGSVVFQAGTALAGETLVASGGRVLAVTARGPTIAEAQRAAYQAVDALDFPGGFCRRDIGWREIARERGG